MQVKINTLLDSGDSGVKLVNHSIINILTPSIFVNFFSWDLL